MVDGAPASTLENPLPLGVVLAGGGSRRFGTEKSLFPLSGQPMAAWVLDALRPWTSGQVLIASSPLAAKTLGVPSRSDLTPGLGPLGGLQTALEWAGEMGHERVMALACDLPMVTPELIGRILDEWPHGVHAIVPESPGPLGYEPLCAGYEVAGLPLLEAAIRAGGRSMESGLEALGALRVPRDRLGTEEEVRIAFTNVNDRKRAREVEKMLRAGVSRWGGGS
ncbi:MAG: molybdenum cofactor guanylyltransferase [Gemmatimonadetes bacterium]|nr:molybdenum cofactor guanylyltransferase [Gemmatimonadota bacterium]NNM05489.1 molybdenum cofactor guanylyltransferase [Gemmatimonadota bacterium]